MKKICKKFGKRNEIYFHRERKRLRYDNHMWGFPTGPSGRKRAFRVVIRSPYFSKKGFYRKTKYFSPNHVSRFHKGYFRVEMPATTYLKFRRVKTLRKN